MSFGSRPLTQWVSTLLSGAAWFLATGLVLAQSDDFNEGNDNGWTRQDPIHQAGFPSQVTFSFPNGGYRIQTAVSPAPSLVGQGRGGSLREDVTYGDSFYVAVDLVNWNDADQQVASVVARITTPGLGTTAGYLFGYNNAYPAPGQGVVGIYRLYNEQYTTLRNYPLFLSPTNQYRLVLFGQGSDLEGRLYQLPNTNTPVAVLSTTDASNSSGYSGLAQADVSPSKNSPTDVTYDNYSATDFCIADQPQSLLCVPGGSVTLSGLAVGTAPLTYQWLRSGTNLIDGANISGASTAALTLSNASLADVAPYTLVAMDSANRQATSTVATVTLVNFSYGSPNAAFDFEDGNVPVGTTVSGNAYIGSDGGSGQALHLTDALGGQQGSFIVSDLDIGQRVTSFDAQFDLLIGGGSTPPADGISFNWATDLPASFGEGGGGTGLTVTFEIYRSNASIPGPGIVIQYGGAVAAQLSLPLSVLETGSGFVPANIRLAPGGYLTLVYNSVVLVDNLPIPGLAGGLAGASFGWGARTGADTDNFWLDNVRLTTIPRMLSIVPGPGNLTLNYYGVLQSATNVAGPYQDVSSASSPYLVTPNPTLAQMFWRARAP